MNQIKSDMIKTINDIPDEEATSFEKLVEAIYIRHCALNGIKDIENGKTMTIEELRKDVANWK